MNLCGIGETVSIVWRDPVVKKAFQELHFSLNILPAFSYFCDDIDRLSSANYLPTDVDILKSRARTTGVNEILFEVEGAYFKMVDVGGQRSERRKWIHCFESVTGVIFFAALSEYDQMLYEDANVKRMFESITLFSEICNCEWFQQSAMILFLNKCDLFREKIATTDLKCCFPEYAGGCNYEEGVRYICKKFLSVSKNPDQKIHVHVTCATDTEMVSKVFRSVRETLRIQAFGDMFGGPRGGI